MDSPLAVYRAGRISHPWRIIIIIIIIILMVVISGVEVSGVVDFRDGSRNGVISDWSIDWLIEWVSEWVSEWVNECFGYGLGASNIRDIW